MRHQTNKDEVAIRYLLGDLSDEERDRMEMDYFQDDALHEELLAVEEELIGSYVRGELTPEQRVRFEKRYLAAAEGRERVEFARTLSGYIESIPPKETRKTPWQDSWFAFFRQLSLARRFAAIAAAATILALPAIIILRSRQGESIGPVASQTTLPSPIPAPGPPAITTPHALQVPVLSLILLPRQRDLAAGNTLLVPQGAYQVDLKVRLDEDLYPSYGATLESPDMLHLGRADGLKAQTTPKGLREVTVRFASGILRPGDYILRLIGTGQRGETEEVGTYSFSIVAAKDQSPEIKR